MLALLLAQSMLNPPLKIEEIELRFNLGLLCLHNKIQPRLNQGWIVPLSKILGSRLRQNTIMV